MMKAPGRVIHVTGPFTAYCSQPFDTEYNSSKYHGTPGCKALTDRPGDRNRLFEHRFANAHDMCHFAYRTETRPCRICLLEPALRVVLRSAPGVPESFVTFSSQPSPADPQENVRWYKWGEVTESGEARLTRLVAALGLKTAQTSPVGKVAYGFVPTAGAEILAWNLRAFSFDGVDKLPAPITVETFWTLESDSPRQLGKATFDPFEIAVLLEN